MIADLESVNFLSFAVARTRQETIWSEAVESFNDGTVATLAATNLRLQTFGVVKNVGTE